MVNAELIVDAKLRKAYEKDGYVVAPLLEPADVAELSALYESFPSGMSTGFYTTLWSEDPKYRQAVRQGVQRVLARRLPGVLKDGRVILCQLAVKQAGGGDSTCPMHCDWSFTDESIHQGISLWIPLIDIEPEVGPLRVVPGSHRVYRRIRPNQPQEVHYNVFDEILPELEAHRAREVFMRAGEAVIYDGAILHGSRGNRSTRDRVAVVAVVVPREARLYHYWQEDLRFAEVFEVDEEFLATEVRWGRRPVGKPVVEVIDLPSRSRPLTLEEFDREVALPSTKRLSLSALDPWRSVTFNDLVQSELDYLGSSKQPLLDMSAIETLRAVLEPYWSFGVREKMLDLPEAIDAVHRLVGPTVSKLFPEYEIYRASFFTNRAGTNDEKSGLIHDEAIVDGTRHRPISLLIPLGGIDGPGVLSVLDGSHRTSRRATGSIVSSPKIDVDPIIWSRLTRTIPLLLGEAFIYDGRLLHYLPPSTSTSPFFGIRCQCFPKGAMHRRYRPLPAGRSDHWEVSLSSPSDASSATDNADALNASREIVRPDSPISATVIAEGLKFARSMEEPFVAPLALGEVEWSVVTRQEKDVMPTTPPTTPKWEESAVRRIFHDDSLEREFRHAGYVVIPLLDDDTTAKLLEFFYATSPPNIAGFHGTMYHKDRDYRVRVDGMLRPALEQAVAKYLINYRCVMCNFMVKEPGEPASEMPLHLDWSFVKEPALRSVHIWCPLVNVDHENGNLAVTPGTHHLGDPVRAFADDIPFREQIELLRDRFTREIPMKAGMAVLFDGGLLHSSPPNMSADRRVTAQAIGIPIESPVYHSWRATPTQVETFQLPDEFFFDYVLHQRPQSIEPAEVIEYVARQLTADELAVLEKYQPAEPAMKK
ncbi:phytanoyl-CoA dioxygenase family protein [bacterium]|nr:phytanoyl-CoA dioxygenase family protein [bacterium]